MNELGASIFLTVSVLASAEIVHKMLFGELST